MFGMMPSERKRMVPKERTLFDLDRNFENFFSDMFFPSYFSHSGLMKVDIREEDGAYLLDAELPGVNKQDIDIEVAEGRLTIKVEKEEKSEEEKENYIRRERYASSICRSFDLENIDSGKIEAKLENGVLSLKLPKLEVRRVEGRKIDIK
jgi:HSP20 family protein